MEEVIDKTLKSFGKIFNDEIRFVSVQEVLYASDLFKYDYLRVLNSIKKRVTGASFSESNFVNAFMGKDCLNEVINSIS